MAMALDAPDTLLWPILDFFFLVTILLFKEPESFFVADGSTEFDLFEPVCYLLSSTAALPLDLGWPSLSNLPPWPSTLLSSKLLVALALGFCYGYWGPAELASRFVRLSR